MYIYIKYNNVGITMVNEEALCLYARLPISLSEEKYSKSKIKMNKIIYKFKL